MKLRKAFFVSRTIGGHYDHLHLDRNYDPCRAIGARSGSPDAVLGHPQEHLARYG